MYGLPLSAGPPSWNESGSMWRENALFVALVEHKTHRIMQYIIMCLWCVLIHDYMCGMIALCIHVYLFAGVLLQNTTHACLRVFADGFAVHTSARLHSSASSWVFDCFFFLSCLCPYVGVVMYYSASASYFIHPVYSTAYMIKAATWKLSAFAFSLNCSTNLSDNIFSYARTPMKKNVQGRFQH